MGSLPFFTTGWTFLCSPQYPVKHSWPQNLLGFKPTLTQVGHANVAGFPQPGVKQIAFSDDDDDDDEEEVAASSASPPLVEEEKEKEAICGRTALLLQLQGKLALQ